MKLERANIPPVRSFRCINNQRREPPRSFTSIGSFVPLYTTPISNHFKNFEFRPAAAATVIFLSFFLCLCVAFTSIPPTGLSFRNHVADETRSLLFIFQMTMMIARGAEREGPR